jgi:thiol-disulfide isomerase/thioredoxin
MTSMLLATIVQTAVLSVVGVEAAPPAAETYEEAHRRTVETGKPMVVMVSTDWCVPCQAMKKNVLPRVRERGLLRKVAFAIVNPDRERKLAAELTDGGPIPQLIMYRRKGDGWVRKTLVGGQSVETVEEFIKEGLAQDAADRKAVRKGKGKEARSSDVPTARHERGHDGDEATQRG